MKITAKGGSKNICKSFDTEGINNDNFLSVKASIPVTTNLGDKIAEASATKKINLSEVETKGDELSSKLVIKKIDKTEDKDINSAELDDTKVVEDTTPEPIKVEVEEKFVNGVSTSKNTVPVSPIIISEEVKEKAISINNKKKKKSAIEIIDNAVNTILETLEDIDIESVKDDAIVRAFDALGGVLPINIESFERITGLANDIIDNFDDGELIHAANNDNMIALVQQLYSTDIEVNNIDRVDDNLDIEYCINLSAAADTDPDKEVIINYQDNSTLTIENIFPTEEYSDEIESEYEVSEEVEDTENDTVEVPQAQTNNSYIGLQFYHAKTVNVKDLFPTEQPQDVIVFVDDDGKYVDVNGNIAGAYTINDQSVNATTIVSKKWLDDITAMLEDETEEDITEEEMTESFKNTQQKKYSKNEESDDDIIESAPVGAFPINAAMSTEEFLNNLEEEEIEENSEEE